MSNVKNLSTGLNVDEIEREARAELAAEKSKDAKNELKTLYRRLADAEQVVAGIKVLIDDTKQRLADGTA